MSQSDLRMALVQNRPWRSRFGVCGCLAFAVFTLGREFPVYAASIDCASVAVHCVGSGQEFDTDSVADPADAFQAAADAAGPGDEFRIKGGTYQHNVAEASGSVPQFMTVATSGTASQPIVIAPFPGEKVLLEGYGFESGGTSAWSSP